MTELSASRRAHLSKLGWWWIGGLFALFACGWIAEWFDHATELTPDHSDALEFWLIAACVIALISALVVFSQSSGPVLSRVLMSFLAAPLLSVLGVFILGGEATAIIADIRDFPGDRTKTFEALLVVRRGYRMTGKGMSWHIQTMPIWADLDVTKEDYNFMLAHRRSDDLGTDKDEVASEGYFCAKVTLQSADQAVRVLHAGTYKLPTGTVGICSLMTAQNVSIPTFGKADDGR